MTVTAWRITKRKHARHAFTGESAREFGGRWNHPGTTIVHTAQSQSLAALEMLVHLDSPELLEKYVLLAVEIEEALIASVESSRLPRNWRADPPPARVRAIGDEWVFSGGSVVLRVPSVLFPGESNFLLNPGHPDFSKLRMGKPPVLSLRRSSGKQEPGLLRFPIPSTVASRKRLAPASSPAVPRASGPRRCGPDAPATAAATGALQEGLLVDVLFRLQPPGHRL